MKSFWKGFEKRAISIKAVKSSIKGLGKTKSPVSIGAKKGKQVVTSQIHKLKTPYPGVAGMKV